MVACICGIKYRGAIGGGKQGPKEARQVTGRPPPASRITEMWLAEIWRYPVKSMAGERLPRAELTLAGIPGDRVVRVQDERGQVVTSRSRPGLLLHAGTLGSDGEPIVDGRPWVDPIVAHAVAAAAGARSRLVRDDDLDRFDILPLLVATDGAIAAFAHDGRRLRPNLVIGGVAGLAERTWEGRRLRVGGALIEAVTLRRRCIMTTFDPDTAVQDVEVLKKIHRDFGGRLALDCRVLEPGAVTQGDPVALVSG
jgi:hypothetical protein